MAEFLLRRCANAFPEYLYARLNLGSLFMDKLGGEVRAVPLAEAQRVAHVACSELPLRFSLE